MRKRNLKSNKNQPFSKESLAELEQRLIQSLKEEINALLVNAKPVLPRSLLTEAEAAALLKVSEKTLPSWRSNGKGPNYRKIGSSVRYKISDLKAYIDKQKVVLN